MARTLEQIIAESEPGYAGSRSIINKQISALPGETQSQLDGLTAQAQQSHSDILDSARRRGMGVAFGGIPVGEQVRYDSTVFKPAMANLYANQNSRKLSLEDALAGLNREQRTNAVSLRESELARDEQIRQFNENLAFQREQLAAQARENELNRQAQARAAAAAASSGIGAYLGGGGGGGGSVAAPQAAAAKAATSAQGARAVLAAAAARGDNNAKLALQFVGNDGRYWFDPTKKGTGYSQQVLDALRAVGAKNAYSGPGIKASGGNSAGLLSIIPGLWR